MTPNNDYMQVQEIMSALAIISTNSDNSHDTVVSIAIQAKSDSRIVIRVHKITSTMIERDQR